MCLLVDGFLIKWFPDMLVRIISPMLLFFVQKQHTCMEFIFNPNTDSVFTVNILQLFSSNGPLCPFPKYFKGNTELIK